MSLRPKMAKASSQVRLLTTAALVTLHWKKIAAGWGGEEGGGDQHIVLLARASSTKPRRNLTQRRSPQISTSRVQPGQELAAGGRAEAIQHDQILCFPERQHVQTGQRSQVRGVNSGRENLPSRAPGLTTTRRHIPAGLWSYLCTVSRWVCPRSSGGSPLWNTVKNSPVLMPTAAARYISNLRDTGRPSFPPFDPLAASLALRQDQVSPILQARTERGDSNPSAPNTCNLSTDGTCKILR